jgi:hypothetical protein
VSVSVTALAFWGIAIAGIWEPFAGTALDDDRAAAVVTGVAAVLLWLARWLTDRLKDDGMAYLVDSMLIQRHRHHGETPEQPLQLVRAAH